MSVQAGRSGNDRAALGRALLTWSAAALVAGVAWVAVYLTSGSPDPLLGLYGGVAGLAFSLAVAAAVYFAERARRIGTVLAGVESDGERLDHRLRELVDGPLPVLVARLRKGMEPEAALTGFPAVPDPVLRRLLHLVVDGVASGTREAEAARKEAAALADEAVWLADTAIPEVVGRLRGGKSSAPAALAELPEPRHEAARRVLGRFADELASGERTSAAAMGACANAAARIQAQTTRMLAQLRELEDRHGDDQVFGDLLALDHDVSQLGRLADSIALLSGGRSGRRWTKPIVMESIVRGAMGRISAYRRVQYHSTGNAAVAGFAAEGVMHALAELMDNAANFSPRGSVVHVYVEEEDAGVVVMIEDAGLGMRRRERERAERLVSEAADLTSIPGTRLGLAVVGRLARKHDLRVSFRPSSRGGIGVVVLVPSKLITHVAVEAPFPEHGPAVTGRAGGHSSGAFPVSPPAGTGESRISVPADPGGDADLPKRRRGAALAKAPGTSAPDAAVPRARDTGTRFAAFRQSASGRGRTTDGAAGRHAQKQDEQKQDEQGRHAQEGDAQGRSGADPDS
ncbi:sensor histidine kinase [Actinomadura rugatobispora]|uniref:histidine kinase n=1 Tax=Actinomadura rugatobispora TaxID=1994 RepID=A0ABW1A3N4_9ACTN|nr:hypothetical protein GCM10010200_095220 [Actinomadura rugatobispora]